MNEREFETRSLAKRLWDIDFELPWQLGDIRVEQGTFAEALPFIQEHYPSLFGAPGDRFFAEPMTEAKRRYGDEMDVFLFKDHGRVIGISLTNAQDWTTYYLRSTAILPDYRGRNLVGELVARIEKPLQRAGVLRIESDCCPTNAPILHVLSSLGFIVTSTFVSERWGLNSRLTKFIHDEPKRVFEERYCQMIVRKRQTT